MKDMFYGCSSLLSLPDISKWNTSDVIDISGMFYNCSSLTSFLDISKWNTFNATNMKSMLFGCSEDLKMKIKTQGKYLKDEAFI